MRITGVGSWPGTDISAATRVVFEEFPDLPYLPELPGRGPHARMVGRTAALLTHFPTSADLGRWRTSDSPGIDARRAAAMVRADLDALDEVANNYVGPLKLAVMGPWGLAASIELRQGEKVVADTGARRDLVGAWVDGVLAHATEVERRIPGAAITLQVDESPEFVVAGHVRSASGLRFLRPVPAEEVRAGFTALRRAWSGELWLHHCARGINWSLCDAFDAVMVDARFVGDEFDGVAAWLEAGRSWALGIAPTHVPDVVERPDTLANAATRIFERLALAPELLRERVWLTPACGFAGWSEPAALRAVRSLRECGQIVGERLS